MYENHTQGNDLVQTIVLELKSQGIFDAFRKECIADVDTKPAYQNLRQRVEGSVATFLQEQTWNANTNKNQLREILRKNIIESGFLETGVERIVNQVVNPKINPIFLPKIREVYYKNIGLHNKQSPSNGNCTNDPSEEADKSQSNSNHTIAQNEDTDRVGNRNSESEFENAVSKITDSESESEKRATKIDVSKPEHVRINNDNSASIPNFETTPLATNTSSNEAVSATSEEIHAISTLVDNINEEERISFHKSKFHIEEIRKLLKQYQPYFDNDSSDLYKEEKNYKRIRLDCGQRIPNQDTEKMA